MDILGLKLIDIQQMASVFPMATPQGNFNDRELVSTVV